MSTVPLLLVAIILILLFSIFYLIIYSDYNEQDFENKLRVLVEYSKRTNAEHPLPPVLHYVSEVDAHSYVVCSLNTLDLSVVAEETHDDRVETFNFLEQQFETTEPVDVRVRAHESGDRRKYELRGDDGFMTVDCPVDERFDETLMRCVPIPPCDGRAPGMYGLTERLIDSLVLNHRVPRPNVDEVKTHPTMYLRCLEGGSHVVEECPSNHLFDGSECVLRNDCENRPDGFLIPIFPAELNINEYMICKDGGAEITSCPFGQIFDRRLLVCVDADPCATHGAGYTYITDDIGPAQFYRCLSATDVELITCINRIFVNDHYECSGDARCSHFPNGTGTQMQVFEDDVWSFDEGVLICDNYNVIKNVICDTENVLGEKLFNGKFSVNVHIPAEMYDAGTGECVPFDKNKLQISSDVYGIENVPNDLEITFTTAFVGRTDRAIGLLDTDRLDGKVVYARDLDMMGVNFVDGEKIECYGDYLFDPFEGTRLNECVENELQRTIELTPDQYLAPVEMQVRADADYDHYCARQLTTNFVNFDHFTAQVNANILHSDVCGEILGQIHNQYTTMDSKYTTNSFEYNYESVKTPKYIERYAANIPNIQKSKIVESMDVDGDVKPMFDPFERYQVIEPLFDPWSLRDLPDMPPEDTGVGGGGGDAPTPPPPPPPPVSPTLTLSEKQLSYTCFYAIPTFKLSACRVVDDHIKLAIRELRNNISVDDECKQAGGLANIINAYAYLGDGIGCRSTYTEGEGIRVQLFEGKTFANIDTQSNDGVQYNKWIFNHQGTIMACPDHALKDDFTCDLEEDRLYYLQDLQETH
ncbi:VP91 [Agrotis ipsilon multiple nucleopolyhedrovirus]|uniref:VP91 n=1 Tax=Agrotis ipsilon multiple nucleopolyhedrovirus TaxID=208013 RepID=B6D608_9ABAC|nr:VP91 [Agrotis ipsilon multiple nucleopolyhedrovirus]ACI28795.1 VP91 [Agrotis ipsilon multiple nucleopolyhedrovirus]